MRSFVWLWVIVFVILVVLAFASWRPAHHRTSQPLDIQPLTTSLAKADKLIAYEGLPHPEFEKSRFEEEKAKKKTVTLHDYLFYAEPLELKDEDVRELKRLLGDPGSFRVYSGPRKCGGFHPDFCLEWHVGGEVCQALLCFGCCEMKAFSPTGQLHGDMTRRSYQKFTTILPAYQKNRPKSEPPTEKNQPAD